MNSVLILGNTPIQSSALLDALLKAGIERSAISFASDPADLLEAVAINYPTLVVLDLSLNEITNLDLCSRLKALPQFQQSRFVIIGSDGRMQTFRRAFEAGADYYIPTNAGMVKSLVRLLDKIQAEHEPSLRFTSTSQVLQFSVN